MPAGPNNRRQIETVSRNRQILVNVGADPEAATLAAKRGQDADALAAGLALAADFLKRYGDRDGATGTQSGARTSLKTATAEARAHYNDLRSTLRTLYDGQREHLERLGVARERAASDRDAFLDEARATLAAVRQAPYADAVARVGYPRPALSAVERAVDTLEGAAGGEDSAAGSHAGSTGARDASYAAFMKWMKPARRFLGLAFKGHPEVARRVGLGRPARDT